VKPLGGPSWFLVTRSPNFTLAKQLEPLNDKGQSQQAANKRHWHLFQGQFLGRRGVCFVRVVCARAASGAYSVALGK
jgi:hypothetical protein